MTDHMRQNLFRVDASTKRPGTKGEKSTGLGLLLCKVFAGKNGGEIWVESEPDNGSLFYFTLPSALQEHSQDRSEPALFNDSRKVQPRKYKIVIAEDDDISAKLISVMVKGLRSEIFRVKTGAEAVKLCRSNPEIDLVLMDIAMPILNGLEATRQIRAFNKDLIIIAQTTFVLKEDKKNAMMAGCNDYIEKPFSRDALNELIKKHFQG